MHWKRWRSRRSFHLFNLKHQTVELTNEFIFQKCIQLYLYTYRQLRPRCVRFTKFKQWSDGEFSTQVHFSS